MPFSQLLPKPKPDFITLHEQGMSISQISKTLQVSFSSVYYGLMKAGIRVSDGKTHSPSPIDYDLLYEHFKEGGTIADFCKNSGFLRSTYYHYMIRDWGDTNKQVFMEKYNAI